MGIKIGENKTLLKVSQKGKKNAPEKAEAVIRSILLFVLIIFRIACGIINPIKPMIPQAETVADVIIEAVKNKNVIFFSISIPKVFDFSSLKHTVLITFPNKDKIIILTSITTKVNGCSLSSKLEKSPKSHTKAL